MNAFTRSVLVAMLRDADTPETVRQWVAAEADPADRLKAFTKQLSHDFCEQYAHVDPQSAEIEELLVAEAVGHVDFHSIARSLLKRFGPREPTTWPALEPSAN